MNTLAIIIVISLFLLWNLELIATLLNLKIIPLHPAAGARRSHGSGKAR